MGEREAAPRAAAEENAAAIVHNFAVGSRIDPGPTLGEYYPSVKIEIPADALMIRFDPTPSGQRLISGLHQRDTLLF